MNLIVSLVSILRLERHLTHWNKNDGLQPLFLKTIFLKSLEHKHFKHFVDWKISFKVFWQTTKENYKVNDNTSIFNCLIFLLILKKLQKINNFTSFEEIAGVTEATEATDISGVTGVAEATDISGVTEATGLAEVTVGVAEIVAGAARVGVKDLILKQLV